jgi:hypothetical protein
MFYNGVLGRIRLAMMVDGLHEVRNIPLPTMSR